MKMSVFPLIKRFNSEKDEFDMIPKISEEEFSTGKIIITKSNDYYNITLKQD